MQIGIIGGCQASGLKRWTERMLDTAAVESWHVKVNEESSIDNVIAALPSYDLVISQVTDGSDCGPLEVSQIRDRHPSVIFMPTFVFAAFQPDIVSLHVRSEGMLQIRGSMGGLMSSLVISGYTLGLTPKQVRNLFNDLVYAQLGFFDKFEASRYFAVETYRDCKIDISEDIDEWLKDGAFMYSDNHPHTRVLGTLAYRALTLAGLKPRPAGEVETPVDDLACSVQWPVYPGIARRMGIEGGLLFRRSQHDLGPVDDRDMSLDAMIEASFLAMQEYDLSDLSYGPKVARSIECLGALVAA